MGMYTELNISCELKADCPENILQILEFMCGQDAVEPTELPAHPLFGDTRWRYMLQCSSAYFDAQPNSKLTRDKICGLKFQALCNLKNYNGEIEYFIDWLRPYIHDSSSDFLGYKRYEEDENPTLIYRSK